MGWTNSQTNDLILPPGGNPNLPHIFIGPDIPATLVHANFTFTAGILWYYDATSYYFEASAVYTGGGHTNGPCQVIGTFDPVNLVTISQVNFDPALGIDKDIWMGEPDNSTSTFWTYFRSSIDMTTVTGEEQIRIDGNMLVPLLPGGANQLGSSTTTTSATYTTLFSYTFVKRYDVTQVRAFVSVGGYCTGAALSTVRYGVRINGVTQDIASQFYANTNDHLTTSGVATFGGGGTVPAGTYTVNVRWRRAGGTGTIATDANDWWTADMIEVN